MPEKRTLYDGDEAVYPRTISSEVYVSDGVTFEDQIAESLALVEQAEQALIDGLGYKTYTVRIDLNNSDPEASCEYMDDAIGMTPGYNGWKDTKIIKNIKPCVLNNGEVQYYLQKDDYTKKEDGTASVLDGTDGDVMVEIPKIGYKLWNDNNYQYVSVTNDPNKENYCYYAHSLISVNDCDKIYYGAYLGYLDENNLYSRSSVSPTTNPTLVDFRTYVSNRGSGYSLEQFFPRTLMQCLYVVIYKNLNSQAALGQGYTGASSKSNTGATNSNTFCYGTQDNTTHVKFLGIEDFYGNLFNWLDGIYADVLHNILTDYRNSQFTGNGYDFQFSEPSGVSMDNYYGNIKSIQGTNTSGFVFKSTDSNRNYNTCFSDYGQVSSRYFGYCGGNWNYDAKAGMFYLYLYGSASRPGSAIGSRLMYKHLASSGGDSNS